METKNYWGIEMTCQPNQSEDLAFVSALDIAFKIVIIIAAIKYIAISW